MPLSLKNSRTFKWLTRLFKFAAILFITLIFLVSLILIFLPSAVSTDWSNQLIQDKISDVLNRPVRIGRVHWSWENGIIINKIKIPDLPKFSQNPIVSLDHVNLKINVNRLLHRKLSIDFLAVDLDAHIVKDKSGSLNIETLGKKSTPKKKFPAHPEKTDGGKKKRPFVLPIDVSSRIFLKNLNLTYDDREKSQKYIVKNLELSLHAPSVKSAPVALTVGTDIKVDDQAVFRSTISVTIKNLFNADGALNVDGIVASMNADLPGIEANVNADMASSDLKSKIRIDLESLMRIAAPLLPGFPSPSSIKGMIELKTATGTHPETPLAFDVNLSGSDLQVSGKIIGQKSIGPGDLNIHLNGMLDLNAEKLDLKTGKIQLLEKSYIQASGRVEQIKNDNRKIHLAISPLYLDLNEIISFAQPFIPPSVDITDQGGKSEISLKELRLDGLVPEGPSGIFLEGLKIILPKIILKDKADGKSKLCVYGTRINLGKLAAKLTDWFPASAALNLSIEVDKLLNGKAPDTISISGIRMNHLNADAAKIKKTDASGFGISGDLALDNHLSIKQIQLPDLVRMRDLEQSIAASAGLRPDGSVKVVLTHFDVNTPQLTIKKKNIGPLKTGLDIRMALEKIHLKNLDPLDLDIKNFIARINAENAISMALTANALDTGNTAFKADMKIDSDLDALIKKIPPRFLSGITGGGNLNIKLNATGRRPDAKEEDALKHLRLEDHLGFIDDLRLDIQVGDGKLEIAQTDQPDIAINSITAAPLLAYEFNGKTGKGVLNSSLKVKGINGLPVINPEAPLSAGFSLSASHDFAKSIELHQSLSIAPSHIEESVNLSIDGMDRIISQSPFPRPPIWLSRIGTDFAADITIPDCRSLKDMGLPGLSKTHISGEIAGGVNGHLIPDQALNGGLSLSVTDMDLGISDIFDAQNIDANIDFSKLYSIQSAGQRVPFSTVSGLSENVIHSTGKSAPVLVNSDIYRHMRLLYERMRPKPTLSFKKADIITTPIPIAVKESMIMVSLNNGLPNLDFFQFNLLGGTINGSILLAKEKGKFYINTALSFSGINTAEIFPGAFSKHDDSKADISGSLYADFPITDKLQALLENAAITIEFTHIGSRALERILYALDPYENNEAIVSQRHILKAGSPKKIRIDIREGFLSLRGKVSVKGIEISLPAIRRLNIAQIPGMDQFEQSLDGLKPVISVLQKISAKRILINKKTNSIVFE